MNIVEVISEKGIKTTSGQTAVFARLRTPRPGDPVKFADGRAGRIGEIGYGMAGPDEAHICTGHSSVFLHENGMVEVSGGPWELVKLSQLKPVLHSERVLFWNWGDNSRGAGMGVDFMIARPVFTVEAL